MKKIVPILVGLLYTGCSFKITSSGINQRGQKKDQVFSCEKKAKAKSLQFLEQQYRCTNYEKRGE